jgi:hypothetical protein
MSEIKWTPFRKLVKYEGSMLHQISDDNNLQSEILNNIKSGDVYIFRNVIKKTEIDYIIKNILSYKFQVSNDPSVIEGVKNIHYQSRSNETNTLVDGRYAAVDNSYYFFPWNSDDLGLFAAFQDLFDVVIKINGYCPEIIKKNTPINRVVQRFHLIHYPIDSGEISLHVDPVNIINVNSGIYFSEFGIDYSEGGFYVIDSSKNKINLDEEVERGDLILFSPNLAHGVSKINSNVGAVGPNLGRFFFHMSLVESHEFNDREKSLGLSIDSI